MATQYRRNDDGGRSSDQNRQVAKRNESQVTAIVQQAQKEFSVISASDKLVEWAREAAYARQLIVADQYLVQAEERTIVNAVVNIANVGLTLNPIHRFCTLIARWDKKAGIYVASLMVEYRGLLKLATDVGLDALIVENVYEKDDFEYWVDDDGEHISYKKAAKVPQNTEDNPYVGTFVRAKFKSYSGVFIEFVNAEDMSLIRDQSDAYDPSKPDCVWIKWAGEQCRKSALKRAQKRWPKTSSKEWERFEKAIAIDNEIEGAKLRKAREDATEADYTEVKYVTKEQAAEILQLCRASGVSPYRIGLAYQVQAKEDGTGLEQIKAESYDEIVERLKTATEERKTRDAKKRDDEQGGGR